MTEFGIEDAENLLDDMFAPWVQDLELKVVSLGMSQAVFLLPANQRLCRGGGVVCGQAIAAAADTASVLALAAFNKRFRACTTVDLTTHFMRPLKESDTQISVAALSNGRRMAVTRVDFHATGDDRLSATATCSFAYLDN